MSDGSKSIVKKSNVKINALINSYLSAIEILIANKKHYVAIHLMTSIIELIGGLYDDIELTVEGYSDQRFNFVLNNLLCPLNSKYSTKKDSPGERLYKGLRCGYSHILKPINLVAVTTRSEAKEQKNQHLCNDNVESKYVVVVAEDFLDDINLVWGKVQTDPNRKKRTDKDLVKVW